MIPGICLCHAPALPRGSDVQFALYPNGFLAGSGVITNDPIFFDGDRQPLPGAGWAAAEGDGPIGAIEFFVDGAFVGRYSGDVTSPMPITGFMANADFAGGHRNRHRRGRGRYLITSRELVERVFQALRQDSPLPSDSFSSDFGEFLDVADEFRGEDSEYAAWFNTLNAALRGTMNLAVLAYLVFPVARTIN